MACSEQAPSPPSSSSLGSCSRDSGASAENPSATAADCASVHDAEPLDMSAWLSAHGLDACEVVETLGAGGFGVAEKVRIPLPDGSTLSAVRKTMKHHHSSTPQRSLAKEVAGLQALKGCPHAVQLLAFREGRTRGERCQLLLELAEGGTLARELDAGFAGRSAGIAAAQAALAAGAPTKQHQRLFDARGRPVLPLERVRGLGRGLLRALAALHAQGFAHWDVKPENILLGADGGVKLGDLGSAMPKGSDGQYGAVGGTFDFLAPEVLAAMQRQGSSTACSEAADVFSAGLVLAAATALHGDLAAHLAYKAYKQDLPSWVDPGLKELIEGMMAWEPAHRLTASQALQHSFFAGPGGQAGMVMQA